MGRNGGRCHLRSGCRSGRRGRGWQCDRRSRRRCADYWSWLHDCSEQAGDAGESGRHAGGIVGRGHRAEGREAVDIGLGRRQADGLDVRALDCGDGVVQRCGAALVLAIRQEHKHSVFGARRELLASDDHGVVERSVAVGNNSVDLFEERRPVGGRCGQDGHGSSEGHDSDRDVCRHRCDELVGGRLGCLDRDAHAPGGVHGKHDLEICRRDLSVGGRAEQCAPESGQQQRHRDKEPQQRLHRCHMPGSPKSPAGRLTPRSSSWSTNPGRMPVATRLAVL